MSPSPSLAGDASASPTALGRVYDLQHYQRSRKPSTNIDVALRLVSVGVAVFPCAPTKEPLVRRREASTDDPAMVERLWARHPGALVGIDCAKSNIIVIDADRHGGPDGVEALTRIVGSDLTALDAPIVETPTGNGLHIYFKQPNGERLGNARGGLPPGVDVRGDGGYVVAPHSRRADGSGWRVNDGARDLVEALAMGDLPPLPDALLRLIRAKPERPEPPRAAVSNAPLPTGDAGERERAFARAALDACAADVASAGEGSRNETLNAASYRMGRQIGAGRIGRAEVERALEDAAQACGLVADDGWPSVRASLRSGLDAGVAQPADPLMDRDGWDAQFAAHAALGAATARVLIEQADGALVDPTTGEIVGGHTAADAPTQAQRPPVVELQTVNAASFADQPIPEQEWLVPDLIPANNVTLLSGDGGTGKSLLSLQLAVAVATGGSWISYCPKAGPAVFLSAEDETDELHRRLARIEPRMERLSALTIIPLAGEDAVLAAPHGRDRLIQPTALFKAVAHVVATHKPMLLTLDTAADLFAGNENARTEVRTFISMLRGVCLKRRVTIVLLSHPSQSGLASGSGSSGSTSWNNSVRSRLYFSRRIVERVEDDPDLRVLEQMKSNRSRVGGKVVVRWKDGRFVREAESDLNARDAAAKAEHVFLRLLALVEDQGRPLSDKPGSNYAPAFCARHPDADGIGKEQFVRAMERLFRDGVIGVEQIGPASRNQRRIVFTPGNRPAAPPVFDDADEAEAEDGGE